MNGDIELVVANLATGTDECRLTLVTPERARDILYTGPTTTLNHALKRAGFKPGERVRVSVINAIPVWEGNPS